MNEDTSISKKNLEWGQTPWDNLSREEMLRTIYRMWIAIQHLAQEVDMELITQKYHKGIPLESEDVPDAYWDKQGRGGAMLEMARQVIDPIQKEYSDDSMYHAFFRYAADLLFEKNGFDMIGNNWVICPICGSMYSSRTIRMIGNKCTDRPLGKPDCPGILRKLEWSDLEPKDSQHE